MKITLVELNDGSILLNGKRYIPTDEDKSNIIAGFIGKDGLIYKTHEGKELADKIWLINHCEPEDLPRDLFAFSNNIAAKKIIADFEDKTVVGNLSKKAARELREIKKRHNL